jgi:hypothetical protein
MIRLQKFTQLNGIVSFLKGSFVVANLLSSLSSNVRTILGLRQLEGLVVIWAYTVLVRPKHSDEGPVASLFSLGFPAVVINLDHDFVLYPLADIQRCPFSEFLNKIFFALLLIVDSCFFKMVDDPLIVRRSYLDA